MMASGVTEYCTSQARKPGVYHRGTVANQVARLMVIRVIAEGRVRQRSSKETRYSVRYVRSGTEVTVTVKKMGRARARHAQPVPSQGNHMAERYGAVGEGKSEPVRMSRRGCMRSPR